jgi:hypothetical protein
MRSRQESVTTPLYHYTGWSALKGILTSEAFWFTHYSDLDDTKEIVHGMEVAQKVISKLKATSRGEAERRFLDCLADMFNRGNLDKTLRFYVSSFSKDPDSEYLWREYADRASGFAIALAPKLFPIEDVPHAAPDENSWLGTVHYGENWVAWQHKRAISKARDCFLAAFKAQEPALSRFRIEFSFAQEMCRQVIASPLIWNSLVAKARRYEPEKEFRIVAMDLKARFSSIEAKRPGKIGPVAYFPFPYKLHELGSIAEIVIGPRAPAGAKDQLQSLLARLGYSTSIPIRPSTFDPSLL